MEENNHPLGLDEEVMRLDEEVMRLDEEVMRLDEEEEGRFPTEPPSLPPELVGMNPEESEHLLPPEGMEVGHTIKFNGMLDFTGEGMDEGAYYVPDSSGSSEDYQTVEDKKLYLSLEKLPFEILEKIISQLSPEEICANIRLVSHRLWVVSYKVMSDELRSIEPKITSLLDEARTRLIQMASALTPEDLEAEMILAARFTFYQIMYSEYKILASLFLNCNARNHCPLLFHASQLLIEFRRLIDGSDTNQWNWRNGNVSTAMDNLRNMNSQIVDTFFWKVWDLDEEPFGPLVFRLLECSLCSKYNVTITHELEPKYQDFKCHLSGNFEIFDLSNTLVSPPGGLQESDTTTGIRMLALYICDTIRWGNMFHTLRLRWVCMDRALAVGRRRTPGWPLVEAGFPYIQRTQKVVSESIQELRNGDKKLCRVFEKTGDEEAEPLTWLGLKCCFQLWCPVSLAPQHLLDENFLKNAKNLPVPEDDYGCTQPYLFKMEFKVYVRSMNHRSQGIVESTVWVEETPQNISITHSKQLVKGGE